MFRVSIFRTCVIFGKDSVIDVGFSGSMTYFRFEPEVLLHKELARSTWNTRITLGLWRPKTCGTLNFGFNGKPFKISQSDFRAIDDVIAQNFKKLSDKFLMNQMCYNKKISQSQHLI